MTMTTRTEVRKDLNQMAADIRAIQYSPDGQALLKYLKLKQEILRMDLETALIDDIYKIQGGLASIKEIIVAISG